MAVHVPFRLLFIHRLVTVCTSSQRHHGNIPVKLTKGRWNIRTFSTYCVKYNKNERDNSNSSHLNAEQTSRQAMLSRSRRSLSPLERISSLLPQDSLSPEVKQLRNQNRQDHGENIQVSVTDGTQEESGHEVVVSEDDPEIHHESDAVESQVLPTLPGERVLNFGELLVAECHKRRTEFKKLFKLQTGGRLMSSWGIILHEDIAGQLAGQFLKTSMGVKIFIRRATLEDFVLYMKRGPTITYPKDAATMLMMTDVTEGDCVLESGSGSGAMSLFLSRAVGSKGSVLSVEVRKDHYNTAMSNYKLWRKSWSVRRGEEWPDNVQFHNADLRVSSSLLAGREFHAVVLDLINPHLVLPTVIPHLHHGAVCAVYIPNITQVIDLLEGLRCSALPLQYERIIEVPVRDWVVSPARQKDGHYHSREVTIMDKDLRQEEEMSDETDKEELTTEEDHVRPFGSVPYIARPHPEQGSHTAFLVKLRKFVQ